MSTPNLGFSRKIVGPDYQRIESICAHCGHVILCSVSQGLEALEAAHKEQCACGSKGNAKGANAG